VFSRLFDPARKFKKTPEGKLVSILNDFSIDIVLDVGANVGQTGQRLRRVGYSGAIVSFEPGPQAHGTLSEAAANDAKWTVAPRTAIGDTDGEIVLNVSQETSMSSALDANPALLEALPRTANQEKVTTPVYRLDSLWDQYVTPDNRAFLKVDTQGFERQVLNGASEALKKLQGVQLELSLFELYQGEETYLGFLQDLHRWGFEPYMMWETYFSRKLKRQLQIDVVFMRPR